LTLEISVILSEHTFVFASCDGLQQSNLHSHLRLALKHIFLEWKLVEYFPFEGCGFDIEQQLAQRNQIEQGIETNAVLHHWVVVL